MSESEKPSASKRKPPDKKYWFKPGQTGNAGGIPKQGLELRKAAREQTQAALDVLISGLKCEQWKVRVECAKALLDRGWGKPVQQFVGAEEGPLRVVTEVIYVDPQRQGNDPK